MSLKINNRYIIGILLIGLVLQSCSKDDEIIENEKNNGNSPDFEVGSFTDNRDGKEYKTVTIGSQTWMAENLAYKPDSGYMEYRADSLTEKYGLLYNWETANKVAPAGWHLPKQEEWEQLEEFLIENGYSYDGTVGEKYIAKSLSANHSWQLFSEYEYLPGRVGGKDYPEMQNKTGFSALPGGCYTLDYGETYLGRNEEGIWWTSNDSIINLRHVYFAVSLQYDLAYLFHGQVTNSYFLSIRCVKD